MPVTLAIKEGWDDVAENPDFWRMLVWSTKTIDGAHTKQTHPGIFLLDSGAFSDALPLFAYSAEARLPFIQPQIIAGRGANPRICKARRHIASGAANQLFSQA
jgi:hypothetical protein